MKYIETSLSCCRCRSDGHGVRRLQASLRGAASVRGLGARLQLQSAPQGGLRAPQRQDAALLVRPSTLVPLSPVGALGVTVRQLRRATPAVALLGVRPAAPAAALHVLRHAGRLRPLPQRLQRAAPAVRRQSRLQWRLPAAFLPLGAQRARRTLNRLRQPSQEGSTT